MDISTFLKGGRRRLALAWAAIALILAATGAAWACSIQPAITLLPRQVSAGSEFTITGQAIGSGSDQVGLHWNGQTGPLLATVPGGSFSVKVTVPADAAPDVYYVVAVDGPYVARASVEVTASSGTASSSTNTPSTSGRSVASSLWNGLAASTNSLSSSQAISGAAPASSGLGLAPGLALSGLGAAGVASLGLIMVAKRRKTASRASIS